MGIAFHSAVPPPSAAVLSVALESASYSLRIRILQMKISTQIIGAEGSVAVGRVWILAGLAPLEDFPGQWKKISRSKWPTKLESRSLSGGARMKDQKYRSKNSRWRSPVVDIRKEIYKSTVK
jgi:hypothetical protein